MGRVKVSKCRKGPASVRREMVPQEGQGLRERCHPGHLALLSPYLVPPARLFTCITLFTSLILTVRRVLVATFRDGTCEAQRGNMACSRSQNRK